MVAITPGTNATISGVTAEKQMFSTIMLLQSVEDDVIANPSKRDNIKVTIDDNTSMLNVAFNLKAQQFINSSGNPYFVVENYLASHTGFMPGNPVGTFKSSNLVAYFVELLVYLDSREKNATSNANNLNNVSYTYNSDTEILSGVVKLPYAKTWYANGTVLLSSENYLS